jgi:ankyrin repeat protein
MQNKVTDEDYLLETLLHPKLDVRKFNGSGYGLFHLACHLRKSNAVRMFLRRQDIDVNMQTVNGKDGLRLAC